MLDTTTQKSLSISGDWLTPTLDSDTSIDHKIREWNLSKLETLLTIDSLNDAAARQQALQKSRRNSNMLLGAVVGGIMDADVGDDSIVDGVLLGAAFGAICTSSQSDEPKAQVGLLFQDGSSLAVEVNKYEYTQLQTNASANIKKQKDWLSPSFRDRYLSPKEVSSILSDRANSCFFRGGVVAMFLATMPYLFLFMMRLMAPDQPLPETIVDLLPVASVVMASLFFASHIYRSLNNENFLWGEREEIFYSRLNE